MDPGRVRSRAAAFGVGARRIQSGRKSDRKINQYTERANRGFDHSRFKCARWTILLQHHHHDQFSRVAQFRRQHDGVVTTSTLVDKTRAPHALSAGTTTFDVFAVIGENKRAVISATVRWAPARQFDFRRAGM